MPRAVRFDEYGGIDVLHVIEVEPPEPGEGQLLLQVRAAGLNPFETKLRSGLFEGHIPVSFPAAQGTDVAGIVTAAGPGVTGFRTGAEVLGTTGRRGAQADYALVSQTRVLARPAALPWEVAGGLWAVATAAYACVAAVGAGPGDRVIVAGAAGGVGGLAAQLARRRGAVVIGIASEAGHAWLRSRDIDAVAYGDGLRERLETAAATHAAAGSEKPTALIDTVGRGYVELGLELGIAPARINTIADYDAGERHGVKTDGSDAAATVEVVGEVAELIAAGELELPIAGVFGLERVRDAYTLLEHGHPPGKIVLKP